MKYHLLLLSLSLGIFAQDEDCFLENERILGKPLNRNKIWTESPEECLSKCEEAAGCLGMVYHTKFKRCLLFSKIAPKTKQLTNVVSAILADCQGAGTVTETVTEAGTTGAPSGSTSKPVTGEGESEIKIRQTWCQEPAGYERRAIVRQPAVSGKVPLVICLHGNGGNANLAQWKELWDNNLVVAAEGYERSWNIWKEDSKAPDVEFILDLIQKVGEENPNADMDNVVLVGYSNGAGMIHRLLVETENPRPFHKVFPMASTLIQEQYNGGKFYKSSGADDCEDPNVYDVEVTPASPGPMVFQVHGTEDGAIKYTGGTTFAKFLGAQDTVYYYAKAFGYSGSQLADDAGVATSVDNVFKYSYLDGQVNHYKVVGGTHGDTGKYVWSIVKAIINP